MARPDVPQSLSLLGVATHKTPQTEWIELCTPHSSEDWEFNVKVHVRNVTSLHLFPSVATWPLCLVCDLLMRVLIPSQIPTLTNLSDPNYPAQIPCL